MSSPEPSTTVTNPPPPPQETDNKRVENIKQYYQQLCANYRLVTQQLQQADLPLIRRQTLLSQQERLQQALHDFTERVIKPIMNARNTQRAAGVERGVSTPLQGTPKRPRTLATGMITSINGATNTGPMATSLTPVPMPPFTLPIPSLSANQYLKPMEYSKGNLLDQSDSTPGRLDHRIEATLPTTIAELVRRHQMEAKVIDPEVEDYLLRETDSFLELLFRGICESARHRKRPGIGIKDVEIVLAKEFGMTGITASLPHAVPPPGPTKAPTKKAGQPANPHLVRLQLFKRHGLL